jgi:hypothetical protein
MRSGRAGMSMLKFLPESQAVKSLAVAQTTHFPVIASASEAIQPVGRISEA